MSTGFGTNGTSCIMSNLSVCVGIGEGGREERGEGGVSSDPRVEQPVKGSCLIIPLKVVKWY